MLRRRLVLYSVLAVCLVVTVVGVLLTGGPRWGASAEPQETTPVDTGDHPINFSLIALRVGGEARFGGSLRVWNAFDGEYQNGIAMVAVDIRDRGGWTTIGVYRTNSLGGFKGSSRIGAATALRARAIDAAQHTYATSETVRIGYSRPEKAVWTSVAAHRTASGTTVRGSVYSVLVRETGSGNLQALGGVRQPVLVEGRVADGPWVPLGSVRPRADGAFVLRHADAAVTEVRVALEGTRRVQASSRIAPVTG